MSDQDDLEHIVRSSVRRIINELDAELSVSDVDLVTRTAIEVMLEAEVRVIGEEARTSYETEVMELAREYEDWWDEESLPPKSAVAQAIRDQKRQLVPGPDVDLVTDGKINDELDRIAKMLELGEFDHYGDAR